MVLHPNPPTGSSNITSFLGNIVVSIILKRFFVAVEGRLDVKSNKNYGRQTESATQAKSTTDTHANEWGGSGT